jgi:hypothetical protein
MAKKQRNGKKRSGKPDAQIVGWEPRDPKSMALCGGFIRFKPSFLHDLLDAYEAGYEPVVDDYDEDDVRVQVRFNIYESDYKEGQFYGSCYIPEEEDD